MWILLALALALVGSSALTVPQSPDEMIRRAAAAVAVARDAGNTRQIVRIVVPQLDTVRPEDLDPWAARLHKLARSAQPACRARY